MNYERHRPGANPAPARVMARLTCRPGVTGTADAQAVRRTRREIERRELRLDMSTKLVPSHGMRLSQDTRPATN